MWFLFVIFAVSSGFWCEGRHHHRPASPTSQSQTSSPAEYSFTNYIVEGTEAERGIYPWVVRLDIGGALCGGVLIHNEYVLTAAHCGHNKSPNRATAELLRHDLSLNVEDDGAMSRDIVAIETHPLYQSDTLFDHDVGIWQLSSPVSNIDVAKLDNGTYFHFGNELTVAGWGLTTPGGISASLTLQEIEVELVECPRDYEESRTEFCAGKEEGGIVYDTCRGDSGGPIFDTRDQVVVGIVSHGKDPCGQPGLPAVYAKVSDRDIMDFINDIVRIEPSFSPPSTVDGEIVTVDGEIVTVDVVREIVLEHPDPREEGEFGHAVSVMGDTAAVTAFYANTSGLFAMGTAYIFNSESGNNWREAQKMISSTPESEIHFGSSILLSEEYPSLLFIGCRHDPGNNHFGGAVYIYQLNGSSYSLIQILFADGISDGMGHSIALSDGTLAVGGWNEVHLFETNSRGDWEETDVILQYSWGGHVNVDIVGRLLVIGAGDEDDEVGRTHVYEKVSQFWQETAELRPNAANSESAEFGESVSISSDQQRIAIGAPAKDELRHVLGTVYIFRKSGVSWVLEQEIRGRNTVFDDHFGESVLLHGDTLFVGAPRTNIGTVYVFERRGEWIEIDEIVPRNGEPYDRFGYSLSISDDFFLVGGEGRDDGVGVAFVYPLL